MHDYPTNSDAIEADDRDILFLLTIIRDCDLVLVIFLTCFHIVQDGIKWLLTQRAL